MVLTTFFVVILSAFNSVNTACSATTSETACTTAGCIWNPGTCKAVQCSLPNCAAGCVYVAPESSSCVDNTATTCAGTVQGQCVSNGNCMLTDGTCKISDSAKTKCDVPADTNSNSGRYCPEGCNVEYVDACEPMDFSSNWGCEDYDATVKLTECTRDSNCKWETTNGGRCVSRYTGGSDWCNYYSNTEVSECSSEGFCKVSGSSCVFDSNSEIHQYCDSIDITEMSSECDSASWCQVKNGQCVNADGFSGEQECERYSINSVSICSLEVSDYCVIKSGKCVAGFDEVCERYSDECSDIDFCKLSNNKCVFDSSGCGTLSVEGYTECTNPYAYDSEYCKVVTISGSKKCQIKTAADWCPTLSVVQYSECDRRGDCQVKNGQCVKAEGSSYEYCGEYSVAKTESDCTNSYYFLCEISQSGACVPHTPHCNMNAQGTYCDSNNAPADHCYSVTKSTCVNVDCSTYDSSYCASASNNYGESAGCEWSSDERTCVTKNPLDCNYPTGSNQCSPEGCTYEDGVPEACNQNAAITDATCSSSGNTACGQAPGCFWSNTGGTCTEKSCGNSPSYALCCNNNPSCAYCAAGNKPSDCPDTPAKDPDATLHAIAPAFLILAVLWLGWF